MDKFIVFGLILIISCFSNVLSAPHPGDSDDYQGDDYDYGMDDQGPANQQKGQDVLHSNDVRPYVLRDNETVTGVDGKDIVLHCDAKKDSVILWYKGSQLISTGNNLLSKEYQFAGNKTNDLVILAASDKSQGNYYCNVEPQKLRKYFQVIVAEHSMEAIIPESSTSAASWTTPLTSLVLLMTTWTMFTLLR